MAYFGEIAMPTVENPGGKCNGCDNCKRTDDEVKSRTMNMADDAALVFKTIIVCMGASKYLIAPNYLFISSLTDFVAERRSRSFCWARSDYMRRIVKFCSHANRRPI